jgi:translation initiation factor 2B subunit (eIF-2B alpha/beta/delta family)
MNSWKNILILVVLVLIIFMIPKYFTPIIDNQKETFQKIDSLNNIIKNIQENQAKLDSTISFFNDQISLVDSSVRNIKNQKTIIKEIYHEKINNVNSYDGSQIDSFFSDRYFKK